MIPETNQLMTLISSKHSLVSQSPRTKNKVFGEEREREKQNLAIFFFFY